MITTLADTPERLALVYLVLFCGATVQGSVGFGLGLVAAPILMLIQPQLLPGPLIVVGLVLTVVMAVRGWRFVEHVVIMWLLVGFLPGLWLGREVLQILSARQTDFLFGFLVLLAVGLSVVGWNPQRKPQVLIPAGLLSAILSMTTTVGGPPAALALQNMSGQRFRSTLALFFALSCVLTLLFLSSIQLFGPRTLLQGVGLMPPVILGLWVSGKVSRWLDQGKTRTAVLMVAVLSGMGVILRAWMH